MEVGLLGKGAIEGLNTTEHTKLNEQINKMMQVTRSPKLMEIVDENGKWMPRMVSGRKVVAGEAYRPMNLPAYFTARVLTTLDGDTDPKFVTAVQESKLTKIQTIARLSGR